MQLRRGSDGARNRQNTVVALMLIVWAAGFAVVFRELLFPHADRVPTVSTAQEQALAEKSQARRREMETKLAAALSEAADKDVASPPSPPAPSSSPDSSPPPHPQVVATLNSGSVSSTDPWEHVVTRLRTAVTDKGWLALPSRALYAGAHWLVQRDDGLQLEITSGRWRKGDVVGLWRVSQPAQPGESLSLAAWDKGAPLAWMSVESQQEHSEVRLPAGQQQGEFVVCPTPEAIREAGVFVQGRHVVGWSFGPWLANSYLWAGQTGADVLAQSDPQTFYNATFAGGREEKFAQALAMQQGGHSDLQRFTALVAAFALPPKLPVEDTPDYLLPQGPLKIVQQLCGQLVRRGEGAQVAALLTDEVLVEIGDLALLLDMIPALTASQGYDAATRKIEGVGRMLVEKGGVDVPALNEIHLKLYQDWLQSLVTVKALGEAAGVLARGKAFYPNDPYLHLLGVELALLNGNWQEAEQLLAMMAYPAQYQDRAELLARKIAEMKGDEGRIVIRFTPGDSHIPVHANLNQSLRQKFVVDTGASMVSIPTATAEALNLQPVRGGHWDQRTVSTAGGVVTATEVLIDTLEIDGWAEHNVSALIMDIPDQPGVGLLGLNYLSRFNMDVNSGDGKLTLRPK